MDNTSAPGSGYDHLLPNVQQAIMAQGIVIPKSENDPIFQGFTSRIAVIVSDLLPRAEADRGFVPLIASRFARMLVGVGILQPYIEDPMTDEIIVRPGGRVFLDRNGEIRSLGALAPDEHFYHVAAYIADTRAGQMITPQYPVVLTDLAGGERFTAMVPPLSVGGTSINIRRWHSSTFTIDTLVGLGAFSPPGVCEIQPDHDGLPWRLAHTLANIVRRNFATILVSGAFSTGKTTLLNALIACLPENVLLGVAESFRELEIHHAGAARVVVPPFVQEREKRLSLGQAINIMLTRARPDVIIMGEITDTEEATQFLRAGNLGVRAMATIHGNNARGALVRLADLAVREGVPLRAVREQIAGSVDLVVHMQRAGRQRYVAEIARIQAIDHEGDFVLDSLYSAGIQHEQLLDACLAPLRTIEPVSVRTETGEMAWA